MKPQFPLPPAAPAGKRPPPDGIASRAALAQLVEHRIRNAGVTGSSPVSGTISGQKWTLRSLRREVRQRRHSAGSTQAVSCAQTLDKQATRICIMGPSNSGKSTCAEAIERAKIPAPAGPLDSQRTGPIRILTRILPPAWTPAIPSALIEPIPLRFSRHSPPPKLSPRDLLQCQLLTSWRSDRML